MEWTITNFDFSAAFELTGMLVLGSTDETTIGCANLFLDSEELNKVEILTYKKESESCCDEE